MLRLRALREDNRWRNAGHVRYSYSSVVNTVVKTFESAFPNSAPKMLKTLEVVTVLILIVGKNALERLTHLSCNCIDAHLMMHKVSRKMTKILEHALIEVFRALVHSRI